ncbi:MAG: SDR family oxidoreductase [Candidatus Aenigmatarchaeota archaeon]
MGKVVAITGAYKGLGLALAELFANKGYKLVLGGKDEEQLKKSAEKLKQTEVVVVKMDVVKRKDCEKFVNTAEEKFGRLDILINNAGVLKNGSIEEVTEDDIKHTFEVNTFGPIYCSQAAIKIMKKQGSGYILNIGSTSAVDYKSSHIAYGSSKAGLIGFTGCLKTELEGTGIRVSIFSPGGIKTDLHRLYPDRDKSKYMDPKFVADKILEHIENPSAEWHVTLRRPQKN